MPKLPIFKRIQREDFPEAPEWLDKLIYPLNTFFEGVYNILNRSVAFGDNIASETREFTFTTLSTYVGTAATFEPLEFQRNLKSIPKGLILLQIFKFGVASYSPIEGDIYVDWNETNGLVTIGLVRGLAASTKYTLRILLI
jgi:hypothetical protein